MTKDDPRWHVPVRVEDVPETGLHLDLVADETVRAKLCLFAGLRELLKLEAAVDLVRQGNGLRADGRVSARVGQICVVTLEPLENDIDEAFDIVFAPVEGADQSGAPGIDVDEPPEALVGGTADIGAVITEFFLLGIDRYPRKPGAVFAPPAAEANGGGPFAALARLKKESGAS